MERQDRQGSETQRHHTTLMRLLAFIFVYAGLADDTRSAASDIGRAGRAFEASREAWTLSRRACRRLLLLLRPVEAATRSHVWTSAFVSITEVSPWGRL